MSKVVFIGPINVGKTSIVNSIEGREFNNLYENTIGVAFSRFEKDNCRFNLWDTAGQERYMSIGPIYYRNANIVIFVFDVSDIKSLHGMIKYIKYYFDSVSEADRAQKIFIVGNKVDLLPNLEILEDLKILIKKNEIIEKYNLINVDHVFVSAKKKLNINLIVDKMVNTIELPKDENFIELEKYNILETCKC